MRPEWRRARQVSPALLFYTDDGSDFVCSASIIDKRIIVTAAHCIYNTDADRFHANFNFVPAYNARLTAQPYGQWDWEYVSVPTGWVNLSAATYPNAYDYAVIVARDLEIARKVRKIGEYLGHFGWQTNRLIGNHVTQLGYPVNLDTGGRMIRNDSQAVSGTGAGLAGEIGSAMGAGASGGPWIQDFGVIAAGQFVSSTGENRVVGVLSYYVPSPNPGGDQRNGSTLFKKPFAELVKEACALMEGNC
jgi:hypothetical protein